MARVTRRTRREVAGNAAGNRIICLLGSLTRAKRREDGKREREKEKVRSMPLHCIAATCYSISFRPGRARPEVSRRVRLLTWNGTSRRNDVGRHDGVMEITKEERANSNDQPAEIEPPPRSMGRRHWFPPIYPTSCTPFFLIRWMNLQHGLETRYTGERRLEKRLPGIN